MTEGRKKCESGGDGEAGGFPCCYSCSRHDLLLYVVVAGVRVVGLGDLVYLHPSVQLSTLVASFDDVLCSPFFCVAYFCAKQAPGPKRPLAPSKAPTNPPQPQTNAAAVTAPTAQTPAPAAATAPAVATAPAPSTNPFYGMVLGAFRSPALSAIASAGGLSSGDVQNWVMQK